MANDINKIAYGAGVAQYEMQTVSFPDTIPLYKQGDGLKWEEPVKKILFIVDQEYRTTFSQSQRSKNLNYKEVMDYYTEQLNKLGWEGPELAGSPGDFYMNFKKINKETFGNDIVRIAYSEMAQGNNPEVPLDPKGAKIMPWHEKYVKPPK